MEKPKIIDTPNLEELKKLCDDYVNYVSSPDYHEDYIFETAIETVFGKDVWNYINERI